MSSPTKPWYRASKDAWYVAFNGKPVWLAKGRDYEKALRDAFHKLPMHARNRVTANVR